jgi:hypothetical protein
MPEEREKDKAESPEHETWTGYSITYGVQSPWTHLEERSMRDRNCMFEVKLG